MKSIINKLVPLNILKVNHKKYINYEEALKESTNDAYEENELIEVIFKKTKIFKESLERDIIQIWETSAYSLFSLINPIIENYESKKINVLDFGGACGAHYFHLRTLIDKRIKLNWLVVETDNMVKYAKELENDELKFSNNLKDINNYFEKVDLLHTSGTIQCVDDPHKYLNELLNLNSKWILFNRLGLNEIDRDVITLHKSKLSWNGIGKLPEGYKDRWIKYPFTFISEKEFNRKLKQNYEIIAKFNDSSGMYNVKGEKIIGYGLLCRIK